MSTTKTDFLVIGGGPAGLSAALTFARVGRPCVIYDSGLYRNANSPRAHTIPSYDGGDPARWRDGARAEILANYPWVSYTEGKIGGLKRKEDDDGGFEAKDEEGNTVVARKVVIATGIADVLPDIKGISPIWGTRAIHCIFCHGTETRSAPLAFLLTSNNAKMNGQIVEKALELWPSLSHPSIHFLTHGTPLTPEGLETSGLTKYLPLINRKYGIITDKISEVEETPNGLLVHFEGDRTMLPVGNIVVMPEQFKPNPHATFLNEALLGSKLGPMGTVAPPEKAAEMPLPPRMGDDPRTDVPGLFWAGNSGSFVANVNVSVAQGQTAGFFAAAELGTEDLKKMMGN